MQAADWSLGKHQHSNRQGAATKSHKGIHSGAGRSSMLLQAYVVAELKSSSKRKWEGENLSFVAGAVFHQNPATLLKGKDWFSIERYRYKIKKKSSPEHPGSCTKCKTSPPPSVHGRDLVLTQTSGILAEQYIETLLSTKSIHFQASITRGVLCKLWGLVLGVSIIAWNTRYSMRACQPGFEPQNISSKPLAFTAVDPRLGYLFQLWPLQYSVCDHRVRRGWSVAPHMLPMMGLGLATTASV